MEIEVEKDGMYFLNFKNLNSNSQITKYKKDDPRNFNGGLANSVSNVGKEQNFSFSITPPKREQTLTMLVTYIVDDIYEFKQQIFIYYDLDGLAIRPRTITFKNPQV